MPCMAWPHNNVQACKHNSQQWSCETSIVTPALCMPLTFIPDDQPIPVVHLSIPPFPETNMRVAAALPNETTALLSLQTTCIVGCVQYVPCNPCYKCMHGPRLLMGHELCQSQDKLYSEECSPAIPEARQVDVTSTSGPGHACTNLILGTS